MNSCSIEQKTCLRKMLTAKGIWFEEHLRSSNEQWSEWRERRGIFLSAQRVFKWITKHTKKQLCCHSYAYGKRIGLSRERERSANTYNSLELFTITIWNETRLLCVSGCGCMPCMYETFIFVHQKTIGRKKKK